MVARGAWRALLLVAALAACKGGSKAERLRRTSEEAPVQVVRPSESGERPRASLDEREPNDEAANDLPLGAAAQGRLASAADIDRFRVTVAKAGMLEVQISAVQGVDVVLELRSAASEVLAKSDRGGAGVLEGLAGFPVDVGSYEVVVRAFVKPPKKAKKAKPGAAPASAEGFPSEAYELTVAMAEPSPDLEPNFDAGTASELTLGEPATGRIGWSGDVDVWKIGTEVLAGSDALDLALTGVEGLALQLELRDGLGRPIASRKGGKGQALAVRGWSLGEEPSMPPFLFVVVSADRSHPAQGYQLSATVRVREASDERESNDTPERAQPLPEEGAPQSATLELGDVDCFAVPAAATRRRIEVVVDPGDAAMNPMAEVLVGTRVIASADAAAGAADRVIAEVPAGAAAVVRVRGAAKAGPPGPYRVSWTEAPGDVMPPEEPAAPSGSAER